jgi:cysteine desulfurase
MYANNEIGTIQPIKEIAKEIRHYRKISKSSFLNGLAGVGDPEIRGPEKNYFSKFSGFPFFHTDAVQAANYLDLNVEKLGVDLMTISGSKIEGGGSVGVLYLRKGVPIAPIFGGGDQEMGLRPGTENWTGIVKFSKAFKRVSDMKEKESKRLTKLRDYFIDKLTHSIILQNYRIVLNGDMDLRLPNNVNVTIPKIPSDLLVLELSARGIYVSEKSACQSGDKKGSYVIEAIQDLSLRPPRTSGRVGVGSLRFSMGSKTTRADIDHTLKSLSEILQKLKKWYH